MRSRGGSSNNPTARQFEHIYKRLLLHTEIKGADAGNAVALDATSILHVSCKTLTHTDNNENLEHGDDFLPISKEIEDHDYIGAPIWHLTSYVNDVVAYIAGFVVKCLKRCVTCGFCFGLLETDEPLSLLQKRKQYGRMINASPFVIKVCEIGEKCLRLMIHEHKNIFIARNLHQILINATLNNIPQSTYDIFHSHNSNDDPLDTHSVNLVKLILRRYFTIRIHHETRRLQERNSDSKIRSLFTKAILFKNQ